MVEFPVEGGGTASAFEARPSGAGAYPGVIVVQEWWGLNDHIKDVAQRIAAEGFVTLTPDLYRGQVTKDPNQASAWMAALDREEAMRSLLGTLRFFQEIRIKFWMIPVIVEDKCGCKQIDHKIWKPFGEAVEEAKARLVLSVNECCARSDCFFQQRNE